METKNVPCDIPIPEARGVSEMEGDIAMRTRRFAPKEVRRLQLIDAAIIVIAEKGVSGTTTTLVTRQAGLSAGIINLHFENKENLLKATLEYLAVELRDQWLSVQMQNALSPAEKLWGVIAASFHPNICTSEKMRVWFAFFGEKHYRDFYRELVSSFDDERGAAIADLSAKLGQSKDEAKHTQHAIECFADGLWLSMILYPEWCDLASSKQQIWKFLCLHFPTHFCGPMLSDHGANHV